jgi:NAD(P)-dependent dehydrogenase (short-subunit alcohol dehydrogenase family)
VAQHRPVAIVTGASQGAGRGIAVALGVHGCTVYVTGRSVTALEETAAAVTVAGGQGIAVVTDHADDTQVATLFNRVSREQGRLDILVNNACAIHDRLTDPEHFWEKPLEICNMIDVGVRSGFVASWYAAPMMAAQHSGLVVFTSAPGAVHYVFGPAYGAHKAGVDKMASDMAVDFREFDVAALSVWMGSLATGRVLDLIASDPAKYGRLRDTLETPEYTGHVIWRLFNDPELLAMSGRTLIGADMGRRYGIADANGRYPPSVRETLGIEPHVAHSHIIR